MKKLILKEVRENLPLGVLALLFFIWMYGYDYLGCRNLMERALRGEIEISAFVSPLRSESYEGTTFACALLGAVLGWLQTSRERRNRVWEFLAHRPVTLTSIFLSKVVAGIAIYAGAAGLPLLVLALWVSRPGNVPAPFEWRMVAPFAVVFANGLLYYLAGLLAGSRRARWYASQVMAIGLPIIASTATTMAPHFALVALLWLFVLVVLGIAAWASFCNFGYEACQYAIGKPAAALALAGGWTIAVFFVGIFLADIVERFEERGSPPYYSVRQDGTICRVTYEHGAAKITDIEGKQILDPSTGKPMAPSALQFGAAGHVSFSEPAGGKNLRVPWVAHSFSPSVFFASGARSLWYYSQPEERLLGYDIVTRRFIGSLGPEGFATDRVGHGGRFTIRNNRTVGTATELFVPDLQQNRLDKIFATDASDPIVAVGDIERDPPEERKTLVATRGSVSLITLQGRELSKVPFNTPAQPRMSAFRAFMINPPGSFLLWSDPPVGPNGIKPNAPSEATWVVDGRVASKAAVPPLSPDRNYAFEVQEYLLATTMPPVIVALVPTYRGFHWPPYWPFMLMLSTAMGLVCVPITFLIGRRMGVNRRTLLGWCFLVVFFGLPGILAFLSIEEKHRPVEPVKNPGKIRIFESPGCVNPEPVEVV